MKHEFMKSNAVAHRRAVVRGAILAHLRENVVPGETINTTTLMAAIWPPSDTLAENLEQRKKAVDIALKLARDELQGVCALQGPPNLKRMFMGKPSRPWLWYHPEEKPETVGFRCPHCNTLIAGIKGTG